MIPQRHYRRVKTDGEAAGEAATNGMILLVLLALGWAAYNWSDVAGWLQ